MHAPWYNPFLAQRFAKKNRQRELLHLGPVTQLQHLKPNSPGETQLTGTVRPSCEGWNFLVDRSGEEEGDDENVVLMLG